MLLLLLFSLSVISSLCELMDCSMPGFPVFHYILEFVKLTSTELMKLSNDRILCIYLAGPQLPQLLKEINNTHFSERCEEHI